MIYSYIIHITIYLDVVEQEYAWVTLLAADDMETKDTLLDIVDNDSDQLACEHGARVADIVDNMVNDENDVVACGHSARVGFRSSHNDSDDSQAVHENEDLDLVSPLAAPLDVSLLLYGTCTTAGGLALLLNIVVVVVCQKVPSNLFIFIYSWD